jgi:hypothetical protein
MKASDNTAKWTMKPSCTSQPAGVLNLADPDLQGNGLAHFRKH